MGFRLNSTHYSRKTVFLTQLQIRNLTPDNKQVTLHFRVKVYKK